MLNKLGILDIFCKRYIFLNFILYILFNVRKKFKIRIILETFKNKLSKILRWIAISYLTYLISYQNTNSSKKLG